MRIALVCLLSAFKKTRQVSSKIKFDELTQVISKIVNVSKSILKVLDVSAKEVAKYGIIVISCHIIWVTSLLFEHRSDPI